MGLAALVIGGGAPAAHAAGPPVRELEAHGMKAVGGTVLRQRAGGGRVLVLRPGGFARAAVRTGDVGAVVVRGRARRCRQAAVRVVVNGTRSRPARLGGRWRDHLVGVGFPAGAHDVRIRFAGSRRERCRGLLDRVRLLRPPEAPAPAAEPLRRLPLGTSVIVSKLESEPRYRAALEATFRSVTPENEMKMEWLQPRKGVWNFAAADELVAFAEARGMDVRGHALVFGEQTPPWVGREWLLGDPRQSLRTHIHTVMRRYAGRVHTWDVVNEAFNDLGHYKPNPWLQVLGPRYVELAFRYAREADPGARLVFNEFNAETDNRRRAATLDLVRDLEEKGLIDAVGLQMHTDLTTPPTRAELKDTLRRFAALGVEVEITEMDVIAKGLGTPDSLSYRLARQASIYRDAAAACAVVRACTRFTVWGVTDRYSWHGVEEMPLLLDAEYRPKPALDAVRWAIG